MSGISCIHGWSTHRRWIVLTAIHVISFTVSGLGRSDLAFIHNGFHDWKNALVENGSLQKHDKCSSHREATVSWNTFSKMKSSNSAVIDMLGSARAWHVANNVHYIKMIIEVILLCSQQEVGIRGHR